MNVTRILVVLAVVSLAATGHAQSDYTYSIVTIPFGPSESLKVSGIDDSGTLVGGYYADGREHGFIARGDDYTSFDAPDADSTEIQAINARGDFVGTYWTEDSGTFGYRVISGELELLELPGVDAVEVRPVSINARGHIVGTYTDSAQVERSFLLKGNRVSEIAVPFDGVTRTTVNDLNDRGVIVGSYADASGGHGFRYERGDYTTIDEPGFANTGLTAINDHGAILGRSAEVTPSGPYAKVHAFVYTDGEFSDVDIALPNVTVWTAYPEDINDAGSIVGQVATYMDNTRYSFLAEPADASD